MRARQKLAAGAADEAVREYEALLEAEPNHLEALNAVGMWALRGGNQPRALRLLRQALSCAPEDALSLSNLAQVHHAGGDLEAALQCYRQLLQAQPGAYAARLSAARLLELQGQPGVALPHYFRAISDAQREGRWLSQDSTPRALRELVLHAMRTVDHGREALFQPMRQRWQQRYGMGEMRRVEKALRIYLGQLAPDYPDPHQRPTFLFLPDLPASPYLDKRRIVQTQQLEDNWRAVREELEGLLQAQFKGAERVFHNDALEQANLRGNGRDPKWNGFYFERHGEQRQDNRLACPRTTALLDTLPLCRIRDHSPETMFSALWPGTHLLPHQGITNTRVVGHLALIVPPDCALRVVDQTYHWREGEVVVFDDTYMHEAWNRSEQLRVVLIFDLWHPDLSAAECEMIAELVAAIGDFRVAAERF
ncbi:aspartate beta-hydroxylase [Solimonas aquatica]|uniref:Aspartate beta-hydroxylase n=1 Tax=Solimonas aquatica TaxID=489703 RepID=A0A1H9L7D3_9GAMM|nr:aspartyl/asparaginyl beta-hydroxylase domain-containing protein [Solimonas aquatica]SER07270.1 aspartate beta-hydroxylase [Solimonas aquatica]